MGPRVLIVEDERDLASLMQTVLEDEGFEVSVQGTGDCFQHIRVFNPDVIVCDYMLPAYNGHQVLERVKGDLAPSTPFIMMSAMPTASLHWRVWGADEFLPKPFDLDRLVTSVSVAASSR